MKILFVGDGSMTNPASGSEMVLNRQVKGLEEMGISVGAITRLNGSGAGVEIQSLRERNTKKICYYADPTATFRFIRSTLQYPPAIFSKYFRTSPPSAAVCHQPFTCFSLLRSEKLRNVPYIYVFHSPNHEEYRIAKRRHISPLFWAQLLMRKAVERICLEKASVVMVLSAFMQHKVIDIHRILPQQIVINPGGVDLSRFHPISERNQTKKELALPDKTVHLLTVRNLEARMGLHNLLKAIRLLKERHTPIHLTICGDGNQKQKLEELSYKLRLDSDAKMVGFVRADLLPKYYAAADLFILPTEHLEGFGLVTVESMACGTPVLGTPVGGTKEILSKFEHRLLFKSSTPEAIAEGITMSIETYYNDKKNYEQLRLRCREHVEKNYSWQRHVDQLKSIIDDLIETENPKK